MGGMEGCSVSNNSNYKNSFGNESSLPIWALVLAFVFPIVGAIMGQVALGQMKSGLISSINRSYAKAAVIVGWSVTGLFLLLVILYALIAFGISAFFGSLTY
jgi:hypothetical protein